ncbi:MAG: hypothetical protein ACREIQ_06150 [Nitrospiria bacterium]
MILSGLFNLMILTCLEEGVREKNKELVKRLIRLIYIRAGEIQELATQIAGLLPESRTGRQPKWFTVAMDISANAMTINGLVREVQNVLQTNEFIYIQALLKSMLAEINKIKNLLDQHPNQDKLEIYREVIDRLDL